MLLQIAGLLLQCNSNVHALLHLNTRMQLLNYQLKAVSLSHLDSIYGISCMPIVTHLQYLRQLVIRYDHVEGSLEHLVLMCVLMLSFS